MSETGRIKVIDGDILDAKEDIIVHQVNCQGIMGAGLALQLRRKYPEMYYDYVRYCKDNADNKKELLGKARFFYVTDDKHNLEKVIVSIFGQLGYGAGVQTNFLALREGIETVSVYARRRRFTTAIPYKIGCGLGGGDWGEIREMIERVEFFVPRFTRFYRLPKQG